MTPDQERWAEALEIERRYGAQDGLAFIVERLMTLTKANDEAGVERWNEIARRYHLMLVASHGPSNA